MIEISLTALTRTPAWHWEGTGCGCLFWLFPDERCAIGVRGARGASRPAFHIDDNDERRLYSRAGVVSAASLAGYI